MKIKFEKSTREHPSTASCPCCDLPQSNAINVTVPHIRGYDWQLYRDFESTWATIAGSGPSANDQEIIIEAYGDPTHRALWDGLSDAEAVEAAYGEIMRDADFYESASITRTAGRFSDIPEAIRRLYPEVVRYRTYTGLDGSTRRTVETEVPPLRKTGKAVKGRGYARPNRQAGRKG